FSRRFAARDPRPSHHLLGICRRPAPFNSEGDVKMTPRMNIFLAAPQGSKAMLAVEASIEESGLEHGLIELVRLRASQINGCAFCLHMHVRDAVKHGESDTRIHMLDSWRWSPLFSDRERAALNWTESLTRIAETHAPDE